MVQKAVQFRGAHLGPEYLGWGRGGQGPGRNQHCFPGHLELLSSVTFKQTPVPSFPFWLLWLPRPAFPGILDRPIGGRALNKPPPLQPPQIPSLQRIGNPEPPAIIVSSSQDVQHGHICQKLFRKKKRKSLYLLFSQFFPRHCGLSKKKKRERKRGED